MTIVRVSHDKTNPFVIINKKGLEDSDISWAAKGLWAYLISRPDNWEVSVSHLSKIYSGRGGKEKAIYLLLKELIDNGYCQKIQSKKEKGFFSKVQYEITEFKKIVPLGHLRQAGVGHPVKAPTNNKRSLKSNEERTNVEALEISQEEAKQLDEESSFVRSFSSVEEEITKLLTPLGLNKKQIFSFFKYTLHEIKSAIIVLNKSNKKIDNVAGFLNQCILKKWGPNYTKIDKEREVQEKKEMENLKLIENRNKCNKLYLKWVDSFTKSFNFKVSDNVFTIKQGNSVTPVGLNDIGCVRVLEKYIEQNTKS